MEVFGIVTEKEESFDYLRDATHNNNNFSNNDHTPNSKMQHQQNDSVSFRLDTSSIIAAGDVVIGDGEGYDFDDNSNTQQQQQRGINEGGIGIRATSTSPFRDYENPKNYNRNDTNNVIRASPAAVATTTKNNSNGKTTPTTKSRMMEPKIVTGNLSNSTSNSNHVNSNNASSSNNNNGTNSITMTMTTIRSPTGRPLPVIPQTPAGVWTTNTESKSFVNGLLSPFSPLLHSTNLLAAANNMNSSPNNNNNKNIGEDDDDDDDLLLNEKERERRIKDQRNDYLQYVSLQPCRKVSIVVRVTAVNDDDDGSSKRCIFPHYKDDIDTSRTSTSSSIDNDIDETATTTDQQGRAFATPTGKSTAATVAAVGSLSTTGNGGMVIPNSKNTHPRDVVVVNPTAFGRYVPSQITMETAKLVAQVANISTEDWARLYEFHHVMWPPSQTQTQTTQSKSKSQHSQAKNNDAAYNTLDSLSRAVVQDLLVEHRSSLLISLGQEGSCIGTTNTNDSSSSSMIIGLWPKIMNQCSAMLETKGVVRLTMVEILEPSPSSSSQQRNSRGGGGDSFRDLLAPSNKKSNTISLRHHDMKGAIIEGLTEVSIDSMPALLEALSRSQQRRAKRRRSGSNNATATAVIGTLHYWDHAVSYEVNKSSVATVTCVELSSNAGIISSASSSNNSNSSNKEMTTLESITHRKSAVSLGQALRQLLLQQGTNKNKDVPSSELPPVVSYRETTLTKVLQRSMESSKIVLIASVSPLSKDYDQTVATLNYLRRLLVKPGNTLTSPFQTKTNNKHHQQQHPNATTPKTAKANNLTNSNRSLVMSSPEAAVANEEALQALSKDGRILENLLSDPRQRLAKLFQGAATTPSPSRYIGSDKKKKYWSGHDDHEAEESVAVTSTFTPTGIGSANAAAATATDDDTVGSSDSISREDANLYLGPQEESRQVVESPSAQRNSWRQEDDDDQEEDNDVRNHEILYNQDDVDHNTGEDDDDNDKWASEEEIERELLKSAQLNKRSLENEIDAVVTKLHPQENYSEVATDEFELDEGVENSYADVGRRAGVEENETMSTEWHEPETYDVGDTYERVLQSDHGDALESSLHDHRSSNVITETSYHYEQQGPQNDNIIEQSSNYYEQEPPIEDGDDALERSAEGLVENPTDDTADTAKVINVHLEEEFDNSDDVGFNNDPARRNAQWDENDDEWHKQPRYDGPPDNNIIDDHGMEKEGIASELDQIEFSTHSQSYEDEEADDDTLDLEPLAEETIQNSMITEQDKVTSENSNSQTYFTGEEWKDGNNDCTTGEDVETGSLGEDTNASLGLKPINDDNHRSNENARKSGGAAALNFLKTDQQNADETADFIETQTNYDLPEAPLPANNSMNRSHLTSQPSSPTATGSNRRSHQGGSSVSSPHRDRSAFNSFASPYSVTLKTSKSREFTEITAEREELRSSVETLKETLRKVSEDRDGHIRQYEEEIQQLHEKLDEAIDAQRETEKVANEAINAQTSQEQEMHDFAKEREELQTTIESLQQQLENLSENHEIYLLQHQGDIDDFHSKLGNAVDSQRTLEQIADDAVIAHQSEVEKTRALAFEQDELHMMIKTLQSNIQSLEQDHDDHTKKCQQEIRQLRMTLEDSSEEKRSVQKAADDARFELETQAEKIRALIVERDELRSSLTSVKGSAKKNSGDHTDYLRRYKHEIQLLHDKLDEALGDKLAVEKSADEIRFAKDDLERKFKNVEDDLSACRANNIRLEGLRRDEQDTIRKMNAELRKKNSERIDVEKFQNELQCLKRHKDHLESLVAHRKVEYSGHLKDLEEECAEVKSKNFVLEEELSSTQIGLSSTQEQKGEMAEKLKSLNDTSSRLSRELCGKDETVERFQSSCNRLESLRKEDQETIQNLNEEIRKRESESFDVDQLHHRMSRLKQDRDHLQNLLESSNLEHERSMDERANEISEYANQVDTIEKDLEEALQSNQRFRSDAKAQLRSLQESESNLIQNLRQRETKIDRLQDEIAKQKEEVSTLRGREASYSGSAEHEINYLKNQVYNLEINLESTIHEKEESLGRVKNESRSHKAVLGELERSRDVVHRLKLALTNINEELDDRQQDALRADEKIFKMELTLRQFKAETKARVGTLMSRENDSLTVLERTRHENRDLTDNLQNLHDMIEKLRRERDICFQTLKDGQKKLSQLSSKNSIYGLDDILETPPKQMGSRYRESATTTPRSYLRPPVESVTARSSRTPSAFPEIYVTNYNLGDVAAAVDMSTRAEEIAACVAISAKKSMERNQEEISQLRSKMYRLEDERSVEVSALKTKVRTLEKELSYERVENAPTSMYGTSGSDNGHLQSH